MTAVLDINATARPEFTGNIAKDWADIQNKGVKKYNAEAFFDGVGPLDTFDFDGRVSPLTLKNLNENFLSASNLEVIQPSGKRFFSSKDRLQVDKTAEHANWPVERLDTRVRAFRVGDDYYVVGGHEKVAGHIIKDAPFEVQVIDLTSIAFDTPEPPKPTFDDFTPQETAKVKRTTTFEDEMAAVELDHFDTWQTPGKAKFVEAETFEQAVRFAETLGYSLSEDLTSDVVLYDEDLAKMANIINRDMTKLYNTGVYRIDRDHLNESADKLNIVISSRESSIGNAYANYDFNGDVITVNARLPAWEGDNSALTHDRLTGWSTAKDSESILVHELGHREHSLQNIEDYTDQLGDYPDGTGWLSNTYKDADGQTFRPVPEANKISKYAATHSLEFVAESYTTQYYGGELNEHQQIMYDFMGGPALPTKPRVLSRETKLVEDIKTLPPADRDQILRLIDDADRVESSLTDQEMKALEFYALGGYDVINKISRNGDLSDYNGIEIREGEEAVRVLDEFFISQQPSLPEDTKIYRVISNTIVEDLVKGMSPGDVFIDEGFASFTLNPEVADRLSKEGVSDLDPPETPGLIFEVKAPKGTKAFFIGGTSLSPADEQELLLPRDSKLVIREVTEEPDGRTRVIAEVVEDSDQTKKRPLADDELVPASSIPSYKIVDHPADIPLKPGPSGVVKDENVAREEAREAGSQLADQTFYHFTSERAPDRVGETGIRESQGLFGKFVYTTDQPSGVGVGFNTDATPVRLKIVSKAKNPWEGSNIEFLQKGKELREEQGVKLGEHKDLADLFSDGGYDAVIIDHGNEPGGYQGKWLLTLDDQSLSVVKADKSALVDIPQDLFELSQGELVERRKKGDLPDSLTDSQYSALKKVIEEREEEEKKAKRPPKPSVQELSKMSDQELLKLLQDKVIDSSDIVEAHKLRDAENVAIPEAKARPKPDTLENVPEEMFTWSAKKLRKKKREGELEDLTDEEYEVLKDYLLQQDKDIEREGPLEDEDEAPKTEEQITLPPAEDPNEHLKTLVEPETPSYILRDHPADIPLKPSPVVQDEQKARQLARDAGGVLADETFYHFTREEAVDPISERGFNISHGLYGDFVYTTSETSSGDTGASGHEVRLKIVSEAKNPLRINRPDYGPLVEDLQKKYPDIDPDFEGTAELFRAEGYDAIILEDYNPRNPAQKSRAPWLLMFDDTPYSVVKAERADLADIPKDLFELTPEALKKRYQEDELNLTDQQYTDLHRYLKKKGGKTNKELDEIARLGPSAIEEAFNEGKITEDEASKAFKIYRDAVESGKAV